MRSSRVELDAAFTLVSTVRELSHSRDLAGIATIVATAARKLTQADGATMVMRENERAHVIGEDTVTPQWQGKRLPLAGSLEGWAIVHRAAAVVEDIATDPRIDPATYRLTSIKSMAAVPIGRETPTGAIGVSWSASHAATEPELQLLHALADAAAVALADLEIHDELQRLGRNRSEELAFVSRELETFSFTVSHDLRAPVRAIEAYAELMLDPRTGAAEARGYINRIRNSAQQMNTLLDETLKLARISSAALNRGRVDLSALVAEIAISMRAREPRREVHVSVAPGFVVDADPELLRIVVEQLIDNAWKFTARAAKAEIHFGRTEGPAEPEFFLRDNGVGFETETAHHLFEPFQRFHAATEFKGHGVGLATVRRILAKHGGRIRAESTPNGGATFFFTLP
ncbi:sensor histidine kinase [Horticoccus sp. 23ND18S-11]|uniref:sensor histidine kinase n=1 Tax=Horticoccus sp. 23ND18S-11 TaxID=3391832 RepID=UPI0039C96AD8